MLDPSASLGSLAIRDETIPALVFLSYRRKQEEDRTDERLIIIVMDTTQPFTTSLAPKEKRNPIHKITLEEEGLCYSLREEALTEHRRTTKVGKHTASYVLRIWAGSRK